LAKENPVSGIEVQPANAQTVVSIIARLAMETGRLLLLYRRARLVFALSDSSGSSWGLGSHKCAGVEKGLISAGLLAAGTSLFCPADGACCDFARKKSGCARNTAQKRDLDHLAFARYGAYRRQVLAQ
jgi:hypothetical protein